MERGSDLGSIKREASESKVALRGTQAALARRLSKVAEQHKGTDGSVTRLAADESPQLSSLPCFPLLASSAAATHTGCSNKDVEEQVNSLEPGPFEWSPAQLEKETRKARVPTLQTHAHVRTHATAAQSCTLVLGSCGRERPYRRPQMEEDERSRG